jgi:hypothetical protein
MLRAKWPSILLSVVLLNADVSRAAEEDDVDWDPETTHVFCVGLLKWQREDIWPSFPACMVNRRDEQLVERFRAAGVPDDQITYLQDEHATKANIQKAFKQALDNTDAGDLLIFYFCGHGSRNVDTNQTWFANYDAGDAWSSAWGVHEIVDAIEAGFDGDRVLLLADCCHSGALYDEVRSRRETQIAYAVFTSSYAHNTSTGNWTYSDCLLAALDGDPRVDLDGNGTINLQELAHYGELELAFIEGQKSMFLATKDFPRRTRIAQTEGELTPRVGQRLVVASGDKWYRAETIDADGEMLEVHYVNFDDSTDEWVGPDRVRPYQPAQFAEGDKVAVKWETDNEWYPATVRSAWYGLHLVRYDGDDESSDEWVGPKSIRLRTE